MIERRTRSPARIRKIIHAIVAWSHGRWVDAHSAHVHDIVTSLYA